MAVFTQEQGAQYLAKWYISRIYSETPEEGSGIGLQELLDYADMKPTLIVPKEEVFSHEGHLSLLKGECWPMFENTEHIVAADPKTHMAVVPRAAVEKKLNNLVVTIPMFNKEEQTRNITLAAAEMQIYPDKYVVSDPPPGTRIFIKTPHPLGGQLKRVPIPAETSELWDKFGYLCRLIRRAQEKVGKISKKNEAELETKIAEVFVRYLTVKCLPAADAFKHSPQKLRQMETAQRMADAIKLQTAQREAEESRSQSSSAKKPSKKHK